MKFSFNFKTLKNFGQLFIKATKVITSRVNKKIIINIILAAALLLGIVQIVFAIFIYGFHQESRSVRVAAKYIPFPKAIVNYDTVTYNDYFTEKDYIYHFYESTEQTDVDYDQVDSQILDQLTENKIVNSLALVYKSKTTDDELKTTIDEIVTNNGGRDQVEKVLSDLYGLNIDQFKVLVKSQLQREKLNDKIIMKVTASHVLIKVDKDAPEDKVNEAKAKIDGILKEINEGLEFAEAAKKYSEDVGSAESGGELQPFSKGEMVDEFSNAAFSTEVGKISDPVRSDFGWHIIKVKSKDGKIAESFVDWLAGIKDKSLIIKL